ncbi:ATP-binding protein [Vibrio sp. T11.5]|uniref:ATP-binding protein n=1 Tax=Vibrio sp. T11.5 TaxID=2998836 RepID=UPI0022CDA003|nr:ATP-binding protein [Vibrio sp. T11.5]MDA0120372.1 ATP-binding protein [Vibrio sp. T11.5]
MIRAFSVLWLAVFVPIILLLIPTQWSPIQRLNESFSEEFYQQIYANNVSTMTQTLLTYPQTQWPSVVKQYAQHFAYPLKLQPLVQYQDNEVKYPSLVEGRITFLYGDPMALLQRVGDSEQLIYFALNESTQQAALNQAKGTLYLMAESLRAQPSSQWEEHLAVQTASIPFVVSLMRDDQLQPQAQEAIAFAPGEAVSYLNQEGLVELLAPVVPGVWLQVADHLSQTTQVKLTSAIGSLFFLSVSLALVIWVYPLWRDLKRLVVTANAFGHGQLSQRAKASRLSVVSQLSVSFNTMADNIETLIAGQRELTNAIAHDLRTPLYRLRFALEMLEDDTLAVAQKAKYQRSVQNSIEDLDHLINQNLLLARYSRMTDWRQFSHAHLVPALQQEVEEYRLVHPHLTVEWLSPHTLEQHVLFIDHTGLMRAVKNVLSNAGRYARTTVRLTFEQHESDYVIGVEDDGVGVSHQDAERLFEPFVQLDNQTRASGKGHGLGLAIVKQIMLWHEGSVQVGTSSLGGAKFELRWPCQTSRPSEDEEFVTK